MREEEVRGEKKVTDVCIFLRDPLFPHWRASIQHIILDLLYSPHMKQLLWFTVCFLCEKLSETQTRWDAEQVSPGKSNQTLWELQVCNTSVSMAGVENL